MQKKGTSLQLVMESVLKSQQDLIIYNKQAWCTKSAIRQEHMVRTTSPNAHVTSVTKQQAILRHLPFLKKKKQRQQNELVEYNA